MGGEIYCVPCATKMQNQLNLATQRIKRLKIKNPKFFSLAPRRKTGSRPPSPPALSSKSMTFSFSNTKSKDLDVKNGDKKSVTPKAGFVPTRIAKTTSVNKLRKFFELQKKDAIELERELQRVRSAVNTPTKPSRPDDAEATTSQQPLAQNLPTSWSSPDVKLAPDDEKAVLKDGRRGERNPLISVSGKKSVPKIVSKAMEFTEERAKEEKRKGPNGQDDLDDLKAQMRAFKLSQTKAIKSAAKDKQVLYKFESKYSIQDDIELGSGLTAVVKLCVDNISKAEYAVKIISKANSSLDTQTFHREIKIMEKIDHDNIIKMVDYFETTDFIYIVQEVAYGGEMFDRILEKKHLSEKDAAVLAKQMLSALVYMHSKGIVHRDLKPENILYCSFEEDSPIKISDFGFATEEGSDGGLTQALGTQGYCAPEVFSGKPYDSKCDIWSLGVIVYILLSGLPPFIDFDDKEEELQAMNQPFWIYVNQMQQVQDKKVAFTAETWKSISTDAKEFLAAALQIDPKARPTASDLLKHVWIIGSNHTTNNLIPAVTEAAPLTLSRPQDFVRARFEKPACQR